MKIFVEGNQSPAVQRLFPVWKRSGHSIVGQGRADVQLSIVKIRVNSNIPKVLRLDGVYYDKAIPYKEYNLVLKKFHSKANHVVYQSVTSKNFCQKYLGERDDFSIIYNGINPDGWYNPIEHDEINVVSCANWRRWKRLPEIVSIFNDFNKIYPNSKLHILGEMRVGAEEIEGKNIIYYGSINHNKMRELYRTADIYLHLAKNDSCPSTVIEAMAAQIPVITTNACGGVSEVCNKFMVSGDSVSYEPDFTYKDEWNRISNETREEILYLMKKIVKDKPLVSFPEYLHIDNVSMKYITAMRSVI